MSPSNRSGCLVRVADVAHQFATQIHNRSENSSGDYMALDSGEPVFDLVEPGGVGGRVVRLNIGMLNKKFGDQFCFVAERLSAIT